MNITGTLTDLLVWPRRLGGDVTELAVRARPIFGPAATAASAVALLLLVLWIYRRAGAELSPRRRGVLLTLRIAAVCCLLPALVELSLQVRLRRDVKPVLAVAVDASESMSLADQYTTDQQRRALAAATGSTANDSPPPESTLLRIELVRAMLSAGGGSRLARLSQASDLQFFTFDRTARPVAETAVNSLLAGLRPSGLHTSLAASIGQIADRLRGQPTAGILVLSDGANNTGGSPLPACARWRQAGVPVHTVAVGDPEPKDIEIRQVLANRLLFTGDPATVIVRLRQRGYQQGHIPVILRRGSEELARVETAFSSGRADINVPVTFTPTQSGEQTFRVECPAQPGETVEQNNHKRFAARVTSERIRVLYLEHRPRWQYRFLHDAMNRDRRLKLQILLAGAEQVAKPLPPFINALPTSKEAFDAYDLIIVGDIDPASMTAEQMDWIAELVRDDGAGLLLLAGPCFNPRAYMDTPLADLFPVEPADEPGRSPRRPRAASADRFAPQLSPLGRSHPAVQLAEGVEENIERWGSLPGIFWFAPVRKARPAASVLVVHPTETTEATPPQPLPLLAVQHFGRGRAFYCGIDETWRWRLKQGDRIFYRLWGQVIQYLGAPHLSSGQQQVALRTDRPLYGRGETALVTARIEEISGAELPPVVAESEDGQQTRLALTPSPGAEHLYEARLPLPAAGLYKLWIEGHALEASASIEVEAPQLELRDPAANVSLMKEIADNTGGQHCRPGEFDAFLDRLDLSPRTIKEQNNLPLWDRPALVLLFVCLLGAEWVLRRLWQLP